MSTIVRPLTAADKLAAFKACTRGLPRWHAERIAAGMTDDDLAVLLQNVIGIIGGSSAWQDRPATAYQGAGLKIWASWDWPYPSRDKTIFEGQRTIAMARLVYGISDPDNAQMRLL